MFNGQRPKSVSRLTECLLQCRHFHTPALPITMSTPYLTCPTHHNVDILMHSPHPSQCRHPHAPALLCTTSTPSCDCHAVLPRCRRCRHTLSSPAPPTMLSYPHAPALPTTRPTPSLTCPPTMLSHLHLPPLPTPPLTYQVHYVTTGLPGICSG